MFSVGCSKRRHIVDILIFSNSNNYYDKRNTGMTEATGGRRYYNCHMGTGRCGNTVQPAK
jgi:hypothetical protein